MTLVTVTENHILESALCKAMILHPFFGTAKMTYFIPLRTSKKVIWVPRVKIFK